MPTARIAPPTAGGVAGRGFATVKVAGFAAAGRIRQASVPVTPANDQSRTPVRPFTRSPPRKKSVPCVPTRKPPLARGRIDELEAVRSRARETFWTLSSSSRMTRRARERREVRVVAGDARRVVLGELARPAALEELDLPEARELEVLGDGEDVGEGDLHPLARLVEIVDDADDRQVDRRRRDLGEMVAGLGDDDRRRRCWR